MESDRGKYNVFVFLVKRYCVEYNIWGEGVHREAPDCDDGRKAMATKRHSMISTSF